jgi:hypothetical protein
VKLASVSRALLRQASAFARCASADEPEGILQSAERAKQDGAGEGNPQRTAYPKRYSGGSTRIGVGSALSSSNPSPSRRNEAVFCAGKLKAAPSRTAMHDCWNLCFENRELHSAHALSVALCYDKKCCRNRHRGEGGTERMPRLYDLMARRLRSKEACRRSSRAAWPDHRHICGTAHCPVPAPPRVWHIRVLPVCVWSV